MDDRQDIVLVVDYHSENLQFRSLDRATGEEEVFKKPTCASVIEEVVEAARNVAEARGGRVVWIMESTTGWARVKALLGSRAQFILANVLQMPLPPKARRRKTDKLDTARLLREYMYGDLPRSFQPDPWWREVRRVARLREDLVQRQTKLKNYINSYLAHETWHERANLWSKKGMIRLRQWIEGSPDHDAFVLTMKLDELEQIMERVKEVEDRMKGIYDQWPKAQRLVEIRGIGLISAVSILARIGPIERFGDDAEKLVGFAGLAPGIRQSDGTARSGHIGGGGTDTHLRFYLMEISVWARQIPRYKVTYERVAAKRGKKIGRLVVARLLLRSIHKMLRDDVAFDAKIAA